MPSKIISICSLLTGLLYFLISVVVLLSCAASKYKNAEVLYAEGAYEQLIQAQFECQDTSEACFRLKYLQMESYYQLGDWRNALIVAHQATDRITSGGSLSQINRVYMLQANLLLENFSDLGNIEKKTSLLRDLESDLYQAIELNKKSKKTAELSQLQLLLTQTLLLKMDFYEGKNLEIIHDHALEVVSEYSNELTSTGYDKYYRIMADFKLYQPDMRNWTSKGMISGDREELLLNLKKLYIDALALRKIPLYEQGYADQIEGLLKNIDDFMKKLVI